MYINACANSSSDDPESRGLNPVSPITETELAPYIGRFYRYFSSQVPSFLFHLSGFLKWWLVNLSSYKKKISDCLPIAGREHIRLAMFGQNFKKEIAASLDGNRMFDEVDYRCRLTIYLRDSIRTEK